MFSRFFPVLGAADRMDSQPARPVFTAVSCPASRAADRGAVQRELRQAGGVQHLQAVGGLQLARVVHLEGAPAQHRVALHQVIDGGAGDGLSLGVGQVSPLGGQDFFCPFRNNRTYYNTSLCFRWRIIRRLFVHGEGISPPSPR